MHVARPKWRPQNRPLANVGDGQHRHQDWLAKGEPAAQMKYSTFSLIVVATGAAATGSAFSQVSTRGISVHPDAGSATATGSEQDFVKAVAVFAKFSVIAGQLAMMEARDSRTWEIAT
jgi:hypothetical protein